VVYMQYTYNIDGLEDLELFANKIAMLLKRDKGVIFLDGELGAGKTTFTQLLGKALGIKQVITSPTFNIFKRYEFSDSALNHFDLYRIQDNVYDQGFEDYWEDTNEISMIEWSSYLPEEFQEMAILKINIKIIDENKRALVLDGQDWIIQALKEEM